MNTLQEYQELTLPRPERENPVESEPDHAAPEQPGSNQESQVPPAVIIQAPEQVRVSDEQAFYGAIRAIETWRQETLEQGRLAYSGFMKAGLVAKIAAAISIHKIVGSLRSSLVRREAEAGGKIFAAQVPEGGRRWFYPHQNEWVWVEGRPVVSDKGKRSLEDIVVRYRMHEGAVIKIQPHCPHEMLTGQELANFNLAVRIATSQIGQEVYHRKVDPGIMYGTWGNN